MSRGGHQRARGRNRAPERARLHSRRLEPRARPGRRTGWRKNDGGRGGLRGGGRRRRGTIEVARGGTLEALVAVGDGWRAECQERAI